MPSERGEIRLDDHNLPDDAHRVAHTLMRYGMATLNYAAFGTGWRLIVMSPVESMREQASVYGARPAGIDENYDLWLRDTGSRAEGAWISRSSMAVPSYLAEKFDCNSVDGYGIAVLVALVGAVMDGQPRPDEVIREWAQRVSEIRDHDGLPAYLAMADAAP